MKGLLPLPYILPLVASQSQTRRAAVTQRKSDGKINAKKNKYSPKFWSLRRSSKTQFLCRRQCKENNKGSILRQKAETKLFQEVIFRQGDPIGRISTFGWLFTLGSFLNNQSSPNFWATFFTRLIFCNNIDQKWVGLHLGRFFHKLIRSPCIQAKQAFQWKRFVADWCARKSDLHKKLKRSSLRVYICKAVTISKISERPHFRPEHRLLITPTFFGWALFAGFYGFYRYPRSILSYEHILFAKLLRFFFQMAIKYTK
jgi:hypothetical protein